MHYGALIAFGKIQQNATRAHLISVTSGGAGVGVTKPISPVSLFLLFFTIVDTLVAYWMSRPYLTGVKYEMDFYNLTGIFSRSKISLTDKLANGALVTSNPDRHNWSLSGHVTGACQRAEMKFDAFLGYAYTYTHNLFKIVFNAVYQHIKTVNHIWSIHKNEITDYLTYMM